MNAAVVFCQRMLAQALEQGEMQAAADYETLLHYWEKQ